MNNVEEFYERKELLGIVKSDAEARKLFYAYESNDGKICIEINQDLKPTLKRKEELSKINYFIKEKIENAECEIRKYVLKKLEEDVKCSREQVNKDFGKSKGGDLIENEN